MQIFFFINKPFLNESNVFFKVTFSSNLSLKGNENLIDQLNFNFISNNVKGLQSTKKRCTVKIVVHSWSNMQVFEECGIGKNFGNF